MRKIDAIRFSGALWFVAGLLLLYKGVTYLAQGAEEGGSERGLNLWLMTAVAVGFFKGRFVLSKTVNRIVARIASLQEPISLKKLYPPSYFLLIGSMIGLGLSFRFLPLPLSIRGAIDVAIGSALLQGALLYFRASTYGSAPLGTDRSPDRAARPGEGGRSDGET